MAKAKITVVKTRSRTTKSNKAKSNKKKAGNQHKCPVCGKFTSA